MSAVPPPAPLSSAAPTEPGASEPVVVLEPGFAQWCARMRLPPTPEAMRVWRVVAASQTPLHYGKVDL